MRRFTSAFVVAFLLGARLEAQQLVWDQAGPDLATVSNYYRYELVVDGKPVLTLTPTCLATATFTCSSALDLLPGSYTFALTTVDPGSGLRYGPTTQVLTVPPKLMVSPDGAEVPPASSLIDMALNVWSLSGTAIYRNGVPAGAGNGTILLWDGGQIYTYALDAQWWQWTGLLWNAVGPTKPGGPVTPPPIPPPTPTDPCVTAPLTVSNIRWPSSAIGARRLDYTTKGPAPIQSVSLAFGSVITLTLVDTRGCPKTVQKP